MQPLGIYPIRALCRGTLLMELPTPDLRGMLTTEARRTSAQVYRDLFEDDPSRPKAWVLQGNIPPAMTPGGGFQVGFTAIGQPDVALSLLRLLKAVGTHWGFEVLEASSHGRVLREGIAPTSVTDDDLLARASGIGADIHFEFISPCSILFSGKQGYERITGQELDLRDLLRAAHNRIAFLGRIHAPLKAYGHSTRMDVPVLPSDHDIRFVRWRRWSERQERAVPLAGFMGHATYHCDLPLETKCQLVLCKWTGIGKSTTRGLGRMKVG